MPLLDLLQQLSLPELAAATLLCGAAIGIIVIVSARLALRALGIDAKEVLVVRESLIGGLTGIFAIMVAFSAAGIWTDDVRAREVVQREANALESIVALSSSFPDAFRLKVRDEILLIGRRTIEKDWPAMQRRVGPNDPLLDRVSQSPVVRLVSEVSKEIGTSGGPAAGRLLDQLTELRNTRVAREMIARNGVSPAQWLALTVIPTVALALVVVAYNHDLGWQITAAAMYVVGVSAALFVILAHDRPFVGALGIKPIPIELAIQRIEGAASLPDETTAPVTSPDEP